MAAVLGDVRREAWQLGHLMATRLAYRMALMQPVGTAPALLRNMIDDVVDLCSGDQWPEVPRMTGLSPGPATTLAASAPFAWPTGEPV